MEDYFPIIDSDKIDNAFVKEEYREGQKECIEFAVNAFNEGKRIVILECPTGSGKSAIGMTMANLVQDSFYLTITKILQDQLVTDFPDIVDLKGKNAYPCTFYGRHGKKLVERGALSDKELAEQLRSKIDCSAGYCRKKEKNNKCDNCFLIEPPKLSYYKAEMIRVKSGSLKTLPDNMTYSACPYYERVYEAINSKKVSMNFSSFIYQANYTNRFLQRDLLILDEGHNIEPHLLDFVSFSINDDLLQQNYNIMLPQLNSVKEYFDWFQKTDFEKKVKELKEAAEALNETNKADEYDTILNKYKIFIENVADSNSEWVIEHSNKKERGVFVNVVTFKPVFAIDFVEKLLFKFAKRILIMSATILDVGVVCKSLGIDRNQVAAYRMKNRFPIKNRPIYFKPAARMTGGKDKMNLWMPKLVKAVEEISNKYKGKRGIIHTHNFAILDALLSSCETSVAERFITQKEFPDKKILLDFHSKQDDSIIVAPAMHEGIDLKDDLSRFQIICKIPYPNFYDNKQLKRRIEIDNRYYNWLVALKLIQSYGRSIRSETDYADTYIIDETFTMFLQQTKSMLPSWFTDAIKKVTY